MLEFMILIKYRLYANCTLTTTNMLSILFQVIRVDFTTFDTERNFDTMWLFDGTSTLSPAVIGLTGTISPAPRAIYSPNAVVFLWFSSDSITSATGFNATYTSVDIGMSH